MRVIRIAVLVGVFVVSQANATSLHQQRFDQGLAAVRQQDWDLAISCLEESYNARAHSMTAYVLSVAYANAGDSEAALKNARKAIQGSPPLPAHFREGAVAVIKWAAVDKKLRSRLSQLQFRYELSVPDRASGGIDSTDVEDQEERAFVSLFIDPRKVEESVMMYMVTMECLNPQTVEQFNMCMSRLAAGEEIVALPAAPTTQLPEGLDIDGGSSPGPAPVPQV